MSFLHRKPFWDWAEFICAGCAACSGGATAILPVEEKTIPALATAGFAAGVAIGKFVSKRIDDRQKAEQASRAAEAERRQADQARRMVRRILDAMHGEYFKKAPGNEKHAHRVTLFVCKSPADGSGEGKHLAIYSRSGVYQESPRTWPVDDNDHTKCRGVAARIWFGMNSGVVKASNDWPTDETDEVAKTAYATNLNITLAEAEQLNVKSKLFAGAAILVKGEKWGVILLDSKESGCIDDSPHKKGLLGKYALLVAAVLEEVGQ